MIFVKILGHLHVHKTSRKLFKCYFLFLFDLSDSLFDKVQQTHFIAILILYLGQVIKENKKSISWLIKSLKIENQFLFRFTVD